MGSSDLVSFGLVIFDENGKELDSFQRNIHPRKDRIVEKRCKEEFWNKNPEIAAFVKTKQVSGMVFIRDLSLVLRRWKETHKIVWVANPSAYDWQWLNAYWTDYADHAVDEP